MELSTELLVNYASLTVITLREAWRLYDHRRKAWRDKGGNLVDNG